MSTIFALITFITLANPQSYEQLYNFDCNSAPSGWNIIGTVEISNNCPNSTECWDLHASSTATKNISTSGYHYIKIILDVSIDMSNGDCIIEYSIDKINYNIITYWTVGAVDLTNTELILSNISDINNASTFHLKLANSGTHNQKDHCYWDNIQVWGIPYTTSPTTNPTTQTTYPTTYPTINPTINPTNNPSMIPTQQPSLIPTKSPTPSPTLIAKYSANPTAAPTQLFTTTHFERYTTVLSATQKHKHGFETIIVIVSVVVAIICICIIGTFIWHRNKKLHMEKAKHQSFLDDGSGDVDFVLDKIDINNNKNVIGAPNPPIQIESKKQNKKQSEIRSGELTPAEINMTHLDDEVDDDLDIMNDVITKGGPNQIKSGVNADVAFSSMISDNTFAQSLVMDDIVQEMDATPGNFAGNVDNNFMNDEVDDIDNFNGLDNDSDDDVLPEINKTIGNNKDNENENVSK